MQDVNIVKLKALQARFDRIEDVLSAQSSLIDISVLCKWREVIHDLLDGEIDLGHDDDLVSGYVELPDSLAQDDLGDAVRVHLRGRQELE